MTETQNAQTSRIDGELAAIRYMLTTLGRMDLRARRRVVEYVMERLDASEGIARPQTAIIDIEQTLRQEPEPEGGPGPNRFEFYRGIGREGRDGSV